LKKILLFSITAILIISAGCGNEKKQSDGTVTIKFWHSFISSSVPALKELIAKFEGQHPGIKIDAQYIPSGDALIQKLVTQFKQTAPDISSFYSRLYQRGRS
jgi:multiple sugar transport system substrate-binding protein